MLYTYHIQYSYIPIIHIYIHRFIYALGIRHVGEETARDLSRFFGSFLGLWTYLLYTHGKRRVYIIITV